MRSRGSRTSSTPSANANEPLASEPFPNGPSRMSQSPLNGETTMRVPPRYSALIFAPLAFSLLVAACGEGATPSATPAAAAERTVRVVEARTAVLDTTVRAVGLLAPKDEL